MKTISFNVLMTAIVAVLFSSCAAQSHVYVPERRPVAVVAPPPPPFAGAIWVGPEYRWHRGKYVYVAPHYVRARHGYAWAPGYWKQHHGRKVWIKGQWRR
ncbi:MAG: YXWGXW repeat-containing protein [Chitinophagaceae bacterium]|nr:YXWGXW repeat-containing protein [Chitinophagaceae bacterium]